MRKWTGTVGLIVMVLVMLDVAAVNAQAQKLSVAGRYFGESDPMNMYYVELRSDGTCLFVVPIGTVECTYEVNRDEVIFRAPGEPPRRAKLAGYTLTFGRERWTRIPSAAEARAAASQSTQGRALKNDDIVKMIRAGIGSAVIIAKIKSSTCAFNTDVEALSSLKREGASDSVLQAIIEAKTQPGAGPQRNPREQPSLEIPKPSTAKSTPTPGIQAPSGQLGVQPSAPPGAPTSQRIRIAGKVEGANLIFRPEPEYPAGAKLAHIQGTVRLEAVIGQDGSVEKLEVLSGHPLLIKPALDAVRNWRYKPLLLNGNPVEVVTEIDVSFPSQPTATTPNPALPSTTSTLPETPRRPGCPDLDTCLSRGNAALKGYNWSQALEDFKVASDFEASRPNSWIGQGFSALPLQRFDDVSPAWNNALALGGTIELPVWHAKGLHYREGTLRLGPKEVSFKGSDPKTSFSVTPDQVSGLQARKSRSFADWWIQMKVGGKNYYFSFMPLGITCKDPAATNCQAPAAADQMEAVAKFVAEAIPKLASGTLIAHFEQQSEIPKPAAKFVAPIARTAAPAPSPETTAAMVAGGYVDITPREEETVSMWLKPDGSFLWSGPDSDVSGIANGTYRLEGSTVVLVDSKGSPFEKMEIDGDVLRGESSARYARLDRLPEVLASKATTGSDIEQNERIARACLRAIGDAIRISSWGGKEPESLLKLGPPPGGGAPNANHLGMIDASLASGIKDGYRFVYTLGPIGQFHIRQYSVRADPVTPGVTGRTHFYMDNTTGMHCSVNGPAGPNDAPCND